MKKIHPGLIAALEQVLHEIFNENRKADKAIGAILKSNPKWGSKDRAFIAENAYDIVRNYRKLLFLTGKKQADFKKIVQLSLFESYPDLRQDDYFNGLKESDLELPKDVGPEIEYSCPDWLWEKGQKELKENWETEYKAMHEQAKVYLRANTLKITVQDLQKTLKEAGLETAFVPEVPDALCLVQRSNVFGQAAFKEGLFEVQDAGSQLIGSFLDPKPGMRVIDACAGAGGKSLHLANLMSNKGTLIAMDVEDYKLEELKKRARRNGIFCIETRLIESKTIKRLHGTADRLLLDVPCSGVGVLKRNPDAKWKLQPEFYEKISETQTHIISEYSKMLKPSGQMVYATCSIFPSENEEIVNAFLEKNREFSLVKEQHILPSKTGFDGYYMALISRNS